MQTEEKIPILCSNCESEIKENFCGHCGQFYNPRKLNIVSFVSDFVDSFFALHKSYGMNLKQLLLHPRFVVENYWNGYRNDLFFEI